MSNTNFVREMELSRDVELEVRRIVDQVAERLDGVSDAEVRLSGVRFFKEEVAMRGAKATDVRCVARDVVRQVKGWTRQEVWRLCEELWEVQFQEDRMVACELAKARRKTFLTDDLPIFERWIERYVSNWATCDMLCTGAVGELMVRFPECAVRLDVWARSENRWLRRAAAVALILPLKRGVLLDRAFYMADLLLEDPDDMVRKGYGWMLKVAADQDRGRVFEYVMRNRDRLPRTALRYAIEKIPVELRNQVMKG